MPRQKTSLAVIGALLSALILFASGPAWADGVDLAQASALIKAGTATVVVAGGMESMTNAPHLLNGSRTGIRYGTTEFLDHMAHDGLTNPYDGKAMGVFGDMACAKYSYDRAALDAFSAESVHRAKAAQSSGAFDAEIVPVTVRRSLSAQTESRGLAKELVARLGKTMASTGPCITIQDS